MIIKSMSRKAATFDQLAAYIARGSNAQSGPAFVRNLYASGEDRNAVVGQFLDNYRYLPKRKGGNAMYHELIALEAQPHLGPEQIEAALHELAERYCQNRAPRQLVWGRVHLDTGFPHIHLMISANEVCSDRRVRMDRAYFAKVQRDLEAWRTAHLPDLNCRVVYGSEAERKTPAKSRAEGELVRRTKQPSAKQRIFELVRSCLAGAKDHKDFAVKLAAAGLRLYQRGQSWGVETSGGRRYRLRSLGLKMLFDQVPERMAPIVDPRETELLNRPLCDRVAEHLRDFGDGR